MAAPPAKPSPSNQPVVDRGNASSLASTNDNIDNEGKSFSTLKDPPPSAVSPAEAVASASAAAVSLSVAAAATGAEMGPTIFESSTSPSYSSSSNVVIPTYESSESSQDYLLARELLNAGTFEEALSIIEQAIELTKTLLLSSSMTSSKKEEGEVDLHESLAPLHYLYGTTLLYSLEEARDDGTGGGDSTVLAQGVVTEPTPKAKASAAATILGENHELDDDEEEEDDNGVQAAAAVGGINPWAHLPSENQPHVDADDDDRNNDNEGGMGGGGADDDTDDIQIAWENLEAARTIVEEMLTRPDMEENRVAKLQLDLAQIMLREGDLQRLNGRYTSSLQDYATCLELRQLLLDRWDRKIADTQFNLGLTYMSSSSELQKELAGGGHNNNNDSDTGAPTTTVVTPNAAILAKEHSRRGIEMQVECAKTLCGIIARLCGVDPEQFVQQQTIVGSVGEQKSSTSSLKPAAGFKTTGLDDEDDVSLTAVASQSVNVLRKKVASLISSSATAIDAVSADQVYDIQQVLDEIQETIDEAERSQDAIRQAVEIRTQAQRAAALNGGDNNNIPITSADGVTTSIGFGAQPTAATLTSTGVVSGTSTEASAGATSSTTIKPMMVIKKKPKRKEAEDGEESSTKPTPPDPSDDAPSKRAKTEK